MSVRRGNNEPVFVVACKFCIQAICRNFKKRNYCYNCANENRKNVRFPFLSAESCPMSDGEVMAYDERMGRPRRRRDEVIGNEMAAREETR